MTLVCGNGQVLVDGHVEIEQQGKLGNSFITTYDANGDALGKLMVLYGNPRPGKAVLDEAVQPQDMTLLGDFGAESKVTDFSARRNT